MIEKRMSCNLCPEEYVAADGGYLLCGSHYRKLQEYLKAVEKMKELWPEIKKLRFTK